MTRVGKYLYQIRHPWGDGLPSDEILVQRRVTPKRGAQNCHEQPRDCGANRKTAQERDGRHSFLCDQLGIDSAEFSAQYRDGTGRSLPWFELDRYHTEVLVTGYDPKREQNADTVSNMLTKRDQRPGVLLSSEQKPNVNCDMSATRQPRHAETA